MNIKGHDFALLAALTPPLLVRLYVDALDDPGDAIRRLGLLVLVLLVAYGWSAVFAKRLGRPEAQQLHFAVLFCLLLPGPVGWGTALLAASFGWVFGREVFGGKALLSPALLAVAFAIFSFPDGGFEALDIIYAYPEPLLVLACLPGAAWLLWKKAIAWPVVAGAALASVATALLQASAFALPWYGHFFLGTYAIGILFAAPDGAPQSTRAQWLYGALVGALIVTIRLANPDHPDGVAFAILLGSLFAPLLDRALNWRARDA